MSQNILILHSGQLSKNTHSNMQDLEYEWHWEKSKYTPRSDYPYSTLGGTNTSYPIKKIAAHTILEYFYICNRGYLKLRKLSFI